MSIDHDKLMRELKAAIKENEQAGIKADETRKKPLRDGSVVDIEIDEDTGKNASAKVPEPAASAGLQGVIDYLVSSSVSAPPSTPMQPATPAQPAPSSPPIQQAPPANKPTQPHPSPAQPAVVQRPSSQPYSSSSPVRAAHPSPVPPSSSLEKRVRSPPASSATPPSEPKLQSFTLSQRIHRLVFGYRQKLRTFDAQQEYARTTVFSAAAVFVVALCPISSYFVYSNLGHSDIKAQTPAGVLSPEKKTPDKKPEPARGKENEIAGGIESTVQPHGQNPHAKEQPAGERQQVVAGTAVRNETSPSSPAPSAPTLRNLNLKGASPYLRCYLNNDGTYAVTFESEHHGYQPGKHYRLAREQLNRESLNSCDVQHEQFVVMPEEASLSESRRIRCKNLYKPVLLEKLPNASTVVRVATGRDDVGKVFVADFRKSSVERLGFDTVNYFIVDTVNNQVLHRTLVDGSYSKMEVSHLYYYQPTGTDSTMQPQPGGAWLYDQPVGGE